MENFQAKFDSFLAGCQAKVEAHYKTNFSSLSIPTLVAQPGRRFVKILKIEGTTSKSVWAFVEIETGDIYKPATFAAPAKHPRGNINDASNGLDCVSAYGPAYLRRFS